MIDAQQEAKLRSYGFTDKNITALRAVLEDPKRKDRTLHSLLVELKRRFYTSGSLSLVYCFCYLCHYH